MLSSGHDMVLTFELRATYYLHKIRPVNHSSWVGGTAYQALSNYLSLVKEFEVVGRSITGQSFENKLLLNSKLLNGTSTLPLPSPRDRIEEHEKGSVVKH